MRILDLGEAGYEGQTEAQKHYFYIEGDYDQDRGITDYDCEEITKQLRGMGLQAHCEPDETRQGVVQIDTYSGRTTVQDGLEKAGYEADHVPSPVNMAIEQAISESPKFTKADFDENEAKNYHTENGVELAKAFGTPEEIEQMEEIAKNHYSRGHILSHEIDARNEIVGKYFPSLESQEEAMSKMSEGNLGPGDIELLKPMVNMKPDVLKMYAKNIMKKYPHLASNVKSMLPKNEAVATDSPESILAKYPKEWEQLKQGADIMDFDELYQELFSYYIDSGEMPYGVMKARDGDPYQWISDELDNLGLLEAKLTKGEEKEKEHIVKGMKKNKDDFKKRYGDEAEAVMYATATKMAKNEDVNEDVEDETKTIRLKMMQKQIEDLRSNFEILTRLDQRGTGAGDLTDQITTMYKAIESLEGVLGRSLKIVPEENVKETDDRGMNKYGLSATNVGGKFRSYKHGKLTGEFDSMEELSKHQLDLIKDESVEVNELDIKKNFQNIANKVKSSLSSVVNQKSNKLQTKKSFGKDSLASKINWGGQYESDDLNELDTFAPKTDYIKGPGGEYYKIEYRNNSGLTGQRKDDTARFVSVNPASDKEITALDLDSMIAKGDTSIHQGHDHQGGLPFSDRDIAVYAYGDDDYEDGVPNNAKMKLIKVMTTEAEKKKKSELGTKIRSWREQKADMKKKLEASKPGDKK